MNDNLVIYPYILSFITTKKCTAACKNCCFDCSPNRKDRLTLEDMIKYIDLSLSMYKTIKVLVITGGECFTLGKDLDRIISYASKKGLIVRVVTNAYWAKSFKSAYLRLLDLKRCGLKEFNLSTGDEHLEWVPYDNIIYAISAAMKLDIMTIVNMETSPISKMNKRLLVNDVRLRKFNMDSNKNVCILSGVWVPLKKTTKEIYLCKQKDENQKNKKEYQRCSSLFSSVTIDSNHYMYSCCGLTSASNRYLILGKANEIDLNILYEKQFDDFMKIWLFTEGPGKILDFCLINRGKPLVDFSNWHVCQICAEIFNDKENIKQLRDNYKNVMGNVILKYVMLREKYVKLLNY